MQAILYVGHGTRVKEGNLQFIQFIEKAKREIGIPIQEHCFIELYDPLIAEGIDNCVASGASSIAVVPVLLLTAGHAKVDIPQEIQKAKDKYPHIHFTYGSPFGIQQPIIEIIGERLKEKGLNTVESFTYEERQDVMILLVGRGSSDMDANSDLAKIARIIWETYPVRSVETCYLAATKPTFPEGIEHVLQLKTSQVYVLPYLLFTGILMKTMEKTIQSVTGTNKKEIRLCQYLGYDPKLLKVLVKKVKEAMCPICSTCHYRQVLPCENKSFTGDIRCPAIR